MILRKNNEALAIVNELLKGDFKVLPRAKNLKELNTVKARITKKINRLKKINYSNYDDVDNYFNQLKVMAWENIY